MSKKNANPYNAKSNYGKLISIWKKAQVTTRAKMLEAAKGLGMNDTAASAAVTVVLSPRKSDDVSRGKDCLGNISANGHIYFADVLNRKSGEEKRFRLRYRSVILTPKTRKVKDEVEQVKTKTASKSKAKAKTKATKSTKSKSVAEVTA